MPMGEMRQWNFLKAERVSLLLREGGEKVLG